MMTPLERLPPLESQKSRTRIRPKPGSPRTHLLPLTPHSVSRGVAWLLRNRNRCPNPSQSGLNLKCTPVNSPDSGGNHIYFFGFALDRSEEHTSELQSLTNLVCRLLLEK